MPELPEVETVVRGLQGPMVGRTFTDMQILWPKTAATPLPEMRLRLPGQRVDALTRRAKYLQFHLSGGDTLFIHLKMSGKLMVLPADEPLHRHVRAVFSLDNEHQLRFEDMRKFGRVHLVSDPDQVIGKLGPEPLTDDFTPEAFAALFANRSGRLKPLLLNQQFIAGIGNIYADESCYVAKIHPARPVNTLSQDDLHRLYYAIRQVLNHGIVLKGASIDDVYNGGQFQNHFQAYHRTDEPCLRCGATMARMILGGRSTHFCPVCQSI